MAKKRRKLRLKFNKSKRRIDLDCAPGNPRPGDLLANLLKGTGLESRNDTRPRLWGWWTWNFGNVPENVWSMARPVVKARINKLLSKGVIRAGYCS